MQYQESNNNQTLLALCKATEWEKGGLDTLLLPCTSTHVYGPKWSVLIISSWNAYDMMWCDDIRGHMITNSW